MTMSANTTLPTFKSHLDEIVRAEQDDGWLSECERGGHFLLLTQEFVAALSRFLGQLDAGPVIEVCAGAGELAAALHSAGLDLVATDSDPPPGAPVVHASADEALHRHCPAVVLGSFVPIDAGVDGLVMDFPSVRHYLVLGARVGGMLGSAALWQNPDWAAEPLEQVGRWMLTRHDVWLPGHPPSIVRHGEAWHFHRNESSD
jgi:hypothetical protein